jgi:hypothetical protein
MPLRYKWELIYMQGPWRGLDDVEFATMTYVDWFNRRRLRGEITDYASYTTPSKTSPGDDLGADQNTSSMAVWSSALLSVRVLNNRGTIAVYLAAISVFRQRPTTAVDR